MDDLRLEEAHKELEELQRQMTTYRRAYSEKYIKANGIAIECIDRVTELEKENAELIHRVDALDLLLDWAIECDFDFDSLGDTYDEFKAEVLDIYGFKESMIKIAECYIEKYGDERWH